MIEDTWFRISVFTQQNDGSLVMNNAILRLLVRAVYSHVRVFLVQAEAKESSTDKPLLIAEKHTRETWGWR